MPYRQFGAQGRNRTTDTAIFSRMLYQLSYLGAAGARPTERALYGLPSALSRGARVTFKDRIEVSAQQSKVAA